MGFQKVLAVALCTEPLPSGRGIETANSWVPRFTVISNSVSLEAVNFTEHRSSIWKEQLKPQLSSSVLGRQTDCHVTGGSAGLNQKFLCGVASLARKESV